MREVLIEEEPDHSDSAEEAALTIGGKGEDRADVVPGEVRKVGENLILGHSRRKPVEHVIDGDAKATNARLAAALARLDGDNVAVVHRFSVLPACLIVKPG